MFLIENEEFRKEWTASVLLLYSMIVSFTPETESQPKNSRNTKGAVQS